MLPLRGKKKTLSATAAMSLPQIPRQSAAAWVAEPRIDKLEQLRIEALNPTDSVAFIEELVRYR